MIFLDTNILLAVINANHPKHAAVNQLFADEKFQQDIPVISTQILFESWASLTRPENANGLGLSPSQAVKIVQGFYDEFKIVDMPGAAMTGWFVLAHEKNVTGRKTYDSVIAATMQYHHIEIILTYNGKDFKNFLPIIKALTPEEYLLGA